MSTRKPREIAVRTLMRRNNEEFVEHLLDNALAGARLSPADRHLCQELVYGIVRWQATLEWLISRKTPKNKPQPFVKSLLELGLYQIFWLDRIPDHAAVNETVELARKSGFGHQAGFVNAILRGYLREFEATVALLAELKTNQPDLGYSHPEWLVEKWRQRWNPEEVASLMEWNNSRPRTFARVNTLKTDPGELLTRWREENVEYDFARYDWADENLAFQLKSHPPLEKLASFQQGLFYVQDPSTLLAVRELNPRPGEVVLDLCAAPGGKLTFAAQMMRNEGLLVAHDLSPERLKLVHDNCSRLGVTCCRALTVPSGKAFTQAALEAGLPTAYDRILLDAPCSNTGVMGRRVELRWRIRPEEIQRLRAMQLELLREAFALLKPGCALVYSTCSLEPEENELVVQEYLREQPAIALESERSLLPFRDRVDGAYVARLKRAG